MNLNITDEIINQINIVLEEAEKLNGLLHEQDESMSCGLYTHPRYDEFDYVSIHKGAEAIVLYKNGGEPPMFGEE